MATLVQFQQRLESLDDKKKLYGILFNAIKATEKIALSLNKQQLSEGHGVDGKELGRYSRATELEYLFGPPPKPRKPKKEGEPYNFEDTGGFFDGFTLLFGPEEVTFYSKDEKTPLLVTKYKTLFGLDEVNYPLYIKNSVLPIVISEIRKILEL